MATVNPAAATGSFANAGTIGRCQLCGSPRQVALVKFQRNIGMIVLRQTRTLEGNLCKTCLGKTYWQFMGLNLVLGPWGIISLIVTPIYLVTNTVAYVSASKKLRNAVE